MKHTLYGTVMPTLTIELDKGDSIYSHTRTLAWMSQGIRMDTNTGGGLWQGLKRSIAGGGLFVTNFIADLPGQITFTARLPGKIMPFELKENQGLLCRTEAFLCATSTISVELAFQKRMGAGLFAGEGFILQKITGPGIVWLELSGEVTQKTLAPAEKLYVHTGHVGMQTPGVTIDIEMVSGVKNILFGGNGLFLATLTGPGQVWLQSMPIHNLAEALIPYLPKPTTTTSSNS